LVLCGWAKAKLLESFDEELRPLEDVNQLPAAVPVTHIPGGTPPAHHVAPRPLDIAHIPVEHHEWQGRRMRWHVREFNGQQVVDETRVFVVRQGQPCSISVD